MSLQVDICDLLNSYSRENRSDTPDFILAQYLMDALEAFERATHRRTIWYDPEAGKK
jgi:hypothetical protein